MAELDDGDGLLDDGDSGGGVMHVFLRAFQGRLKSELAGNKEERVLPNHLADNEWCIGAVHAPEMCSLFGIALAEPSYYRDIHVWLPDVLWGAMPVCPVCESSKDVSSHCFRTNHVGRRIVDVDTTYYVLGRRYKPGGLRENGQGCSSGGGGGSCQEHAVHCGCAPRRCGCGPRTGGGRPHRCGGGPRRCG